MVVIQENHPGQDSMMMEMLELTRRDIHQCLMETCPMFPPPLYHQVESNHIMIPKSAIDTFVKSFRKGQDNADQGQGAHPG